MEVFLFKRNKVNYCDITPWFLYATTVWTLTLIRLTVILGFQISDLMVY